MEEEPAQTARERAPAAEAPSVIEHGKENTAKAPHTRTTSVHPSSQCVREVERLRLRREARRTALEEQRRNRSEADDTAEFRGMIEAYRRRLGSAPPRPHHARPASAQRIRVVVRKRPLLPVEDQAADYDAVTCAGSRIIIHEPKLKVDLQKTLDSHDFEVDDVFDEAATNLEVYTHTAGSLVQAMFDGCSATCFTYGQTGSGKTFTMLGLGAAQGGTSQGVTRAEDLGLYHLAVRDCFAQLDILRREGVSLYLGVSFFEVYCGQVFDLLNRRSPCRVLEDAHGEVRVRDLTEATPESLGHLLEVRSARAPAPPPDHPHLTRDVGVLGLGLTAHRCGQRYPLRGHDVCERALVPVARGAAPLAPPRGDGRRLRTLLPCRLGRL